MNVLFHEGQTVRVRGTRSIVSRVVASSVDPDLARLDLRIVTGERVGETLSVFVSSNDPIDDVVPEEAPPLRLASIAPYRLWERFHDAHRFELALPPDSLSATPQARIAVEPYQRVPAQRALALARPRLLIADDVGLGKTIEAGLVYLELASRRRARRVLIVAPASICTQWQSELYEKFGIEFDVFTRDVIEDVRRGAEIGANPFTLRPRVIVSLDLAKMEGTFAELRRSQWDLAIVDEAHHVAIGDDENTTLNRNFAVWLSGAAHGLLLLSATPHDGDDETFRSLLELLEKRIAPPGVGLQRAIIDPHIVRRLKRDIVDANGAPRFVPRQPVEPLPVPLSPAEKQVHELVTDTIRRLKEAIAKLPKSERNRVEFLTTIVRKRLASSRTALVRTIDNRRATLDAKLETLSSQRDLLRRARAGEPLTQAEQDQLELDLHARSLPSAQRGVGVRRTQAETERDAFDALADALQELGDVPESKMAVLTGYLDRAWAEEPHENILVFTEYRDTAVSVAEALRSKYGSRVMLAHGESDDRPETLARFNAETGLLLVATDVASEGLNLQERSRTIVHYDLPWNPNRLEQRNGRVDRYGQKRSPRIAFLYAEGTYDGELLSILVKKVERQIASLGSVGDVLGALQPQRIEKLFERTESAMTPQLRGEAESQIDDALRSGRVPPILAGVATRPGAERLTQRPEPGAFTAGALRQCGGDAVVADSILQLRDIPPAWRVRRDVTAYALPGGPADLPLITEGSEIFRVAVNAIRELRYDAKHDPRIAAVVHAGIDEPLLVATFHVAMRSADGDVVERLMAFATTRGGAVRVADEHLRGTDPGLREPAGLTDLAQNAFDAWWEDTLPSLHAAAEADAGMWHAALARERQERFDRASRQLRDWYTAECRVAREQSEGPATFAFGAVESPAVARKIERIDAVFAAQESAMKASATILPPACELLGLLLVMPPAPTENAS